MREAIGGTWMMGIVVFFIVLFSGYLAISVNYSKAFKVKNSIIGYIEKNKGMNNKTQDDINAYLDTIGYYVSSSCNGRGTGYGDVNGNPRYCVEKHDANAEYVTMKKTYYTVTVFFKLDLPIIGSIFVFPVYGETRTI